MSFWLALIIIVWTLFPGQSHASLSRASLSWHALQIYIHITTGQIRSHWFHVVIISYSHSTDNWYDISNGILLGLIISICMVTGFVILHGIGIGSGIGPSLAISAVHCEKQSTFERWVTSHWEILQFEVKN